jgi:hypothetical protein
MSLYKRATGYSFESVKIFLPAGSRKPVIVPYVEHVPPDPASMIFWLKNRQRARWKDRHDLEVKDPESDERRKEIMKAIMERLELKAHGKFVGPVLQIVPDKPKKASDIG